MAGACPHADSGQEVLTFTQNELEVLQQWDMGQLRYLLNTAILALGHGRLQNARGEYLEIGGSTGGGSRRILDRWQAPDYRTFLQGLE